MYLLWTKRGRFFSKNFPLDACMRDGEAAISTFGERVAELFIVHVEQVEVSPSTLGERGTETCFEQRGGDFFRNFFPLMQHIRGKVRRRLVL
jgi:hypothetical protein